MEDSQRGLGLGGGSARGVRRAARDGDRLDSALEQPTGLRTRVSLLLSISTANLSPSILTPAASFSLNSSSPLPSDVFIA